MFQILKDIISYEKRSVLRENARVLRVQGYAMRLQLLLKLISLFASSFIALLNFLHMKQIHSLSMLVSTR